MSKLLVSGVSAVKMIDLNTEMSTKKTMVAFVLEIDGGSIHMAMALMNQDTTVLFHIAVFFV